MYEIDDEFMASIGAENMAEPGKTTLRENISEMVKNRVSVLLADKLTDFLEDELENISENPAAAKNWLAKNAPYFAGSNEFLAFRENLPAENRADAEQLFALNKWFAVNLPEFPAVLAQVLEQTQSELLAVGARENE